MKLGYSTSIDRIPIDQALASLSGLGYDGVELTVIPGYTTELSRLNRDERRRVKWLLKEHNLDLPAIAAHSIDLSKFPLAFYRNAYIASESIDRSF